MMERAAVVFVLVAAAAGGTVGWEYKAERRPPWKAVGATGSLLVAVGFVFALDLALGRWVTTGPGVPQYGALSATLAIAATVAAASGTAAVGFWFGWVLRSPDEARGLPGAFSGGGESGATSRNRERAMSPKAGDPPGGAA